MRVISLLPAATEIVAALDAGHLLVGVSHECDGPPPVTDLPRVTRSRVPRHDAPAAIDATVRALAASGQPLYDVDASLIAELRPDLLLTQAVCDVCAVREGDVRALAARLTPAPRVVALGASTFTGVLDDIATVGAAIDHAEESLRLRNTITERLDRVHRTLKAARAPRPRVAVIEWTDPEFAAGHWTPELVRRAGGVDVLAEPGVRSVVVDPAFVRQCDPGIILVSPCGYDVFGATALAQEMLDRPSWAWAREHEVWALDANALLSRPGPRLADAVEVMASIFAPSLFDPPPSAFARRIPVRREAPPPDMP